MQLDQDSRALLAVEQNVIRPAQVRRDAGCVSDRLGRSEPERESDQRQAVGADLQAKDLGHVESRIRLRVPRSAEPALSGCLLLATTTVSEGSPSRASSIAFCIVEATIEAMDLGHVQLLSELDAEIEVYRLRLVGDCAG